YSSESRRPAAAEPPPSSVRGSDAPVLVTTATQAPLNPAVALLPLGIGQFAEHRPLAGGLFLTSELLLLGANIGAYVVAQRFVTPQGTYHQAPTVNALKWVVDISLALLVADIIGGAVDGLVHRTGS